MNPQVKNYAIVTAAYWSFMLTDGALRMLTLLYFHHLGYSAVTLAFLFLFYEFFGIVTNLFGGWLAHRFGLKSTLISGLILQVGAIFMLSMLSESWQVMYAIPYVMAAQALSGIAKDLTKMSSKTAIKYLIPTDKPTDEPTDDSISAENTQRQKLFKWVAILTGSKNAIKGAGFFVGGFLLATLGFQQALWSMAGLIALVLIGSLALLSGDIGQAKVKSKLKGVLDQNPAIKILSAARVFLFGARDIWFVVAIPIFLTTAFEWDYSTVGAFMAVWVIVYGFVQAIAPALFHFREKGHAPTGRTATKLALLLFGSMLAIVICFLLQLELKLTITIGLYVFGAIFAINSSVHSFLVLDYADGDKAAVNVGFYYMANAAGRLVGTLLSGTLYHVGTLMAAKENATGAASNAAYGGVSYCLMGAALFLLLSTVICTRLPKSAI